MPDTTPATIAPIALGEQAARHLMQRHGLPAAKDWFQENSPSDPREAADKSTYEWWIGFGRMLSSVSGTA